MDTRSHAWQSDQLTGYFGHLRLWSSYCEFLLDLHSQPELAWDVALQRMSWA